MSQDSFPSDFAWKCTKEMPQSQIEECDLDLWCHSQI